KLIEGFLSELWKDDGSKLAGAMRYSLLSGGKRIRPVITLAFCEMCGGRAEDALPAACAVELIHTYSLIHDDLPCMDDDNFRRGRPANHKVYGEAMALLAGDGLLSYATVLLSGRTSALADAVGGAAFDMVRGQALEIEGCADTREVYRLKTGALFIAAAKAGCIIAGAGAEGLDAAAAYANALGLAFQYRDDMLDMGGPCSDGIDRAGEIIRLTGAAKEALAPFDNSTFLLSLADSLSEREM
ncbi:MAG: polyprenyl synthetase family protein, partial [Oscillospiraceae bacterium]|nr:polyprenyl synthetase family protein [Oscillospiraceae bacterium]